MGRSSSTRSKSTRWNRTSFRSWSAGELDVAVEGLVQVVDPAGDVLRLALQRTVGGGEQAVEPEGPAFLRGEARRPIEQGVGEQGPAP
jgi:hypothetical protein